MNAWDDGAREIDAELGFHLAEATDELVATGVPREEARERALAQLGNIERWRAECLHLRNGRKTMLVKLQWAAIAALVLALGFVELRSFRAHKAHEHELASLRAELAAERTATREREFLEATAEVIRERIHSAGMARSFDVRVSGEELAAALPGQVHFEPRGNRRMFLHVSVNGDLQLRNGSIRIDPASPSGPGSGR